MTKYKHIIENIKNFFRANQLRDIKITFSGGKDSTALLILVFESLKELKREGFENFLPLEIINADTSMEMPHYQHYVDNVLKNIEKYIKKENINAEVVKVKPELKNRFFNLIIGKGMPLPRKDNRWCSDRLKKINLNKEAIYIHGVRKEESASRKKLLESEENKTNSKTKSLKIINGIVSFTPIEDLGIADVWDIIMNASQEWIEPDDLLNLYKKASLNDKTNDARYGCWLCPLAGAKDKTLGKLTKTYKVYKILEEYRDFIVNQFGNSWSINKYTPIRDIYNHRNFKINIYTAKNQNYSTVSPGGFNLTTRLFMFYRLIDTFKNVVQIDQNFPYKTYLNEDDINYIQNLWFLEGDIKLSAFKYKHISSLYDVSKLKLSPENTLIYKTLRLIYKKLKSEPALTDFFLALRSENNFNPIRKEIHILKYIYESFSFDIKNEERLYALYKKSRSSVLEKLEEEGMYLGDSDFEDYVNYEWSQNKIGFWRFLNLIKNDEIDLTNEKTRKMFEEYIEIAKEINQKLLENPEFIFIEDLEKLPLEEKMAYFNDTGEKDGMCFDVEIVKKIKLK